MAYLPCRRQTQRLKASVGHACKLERSKLLSLLGQAVHHCSLADPLGGWLSPNLQGNLRWTQLLGQAGHHSMLPGLATHSMDKKDLHWTDAV